MFFRISGAVGLKAGLEHLNYHDLWPRGHQPNQPDGGVKTNFGQLGSVHLNFTDEYIFDSI